jgi:hypothetical protein
LAYGQNNSQSTYPDPSINPALKGYDWILSYIRAGYSDGTGHMPFGYLNTGTLKMTEIAMYCLGKQPVDKYKKMMKPGDPSDEGWRAIDFTVPAFMCKRREIALSKLHQRRYDISAYAIDSISRSEEDEFFNKLKIKILMRQEAIKAGSDLANSPELAPQPGEPQDMEEWQMYKDHTYKHQMAQEAEDAINLAFGRNDFDDLRKRLEAHLYDYGVGAFSTELDEKGMVKICVEDPEYLGLSYCEKPDFSDLVHWWKLVPTYVADLAPYYTKDQLDKICQQALNKFGNPTSYTPITGLFNPAWSRFKVMVCKMKFLSWNDTVYKEELDSAENQRFYRSKFENKKFLAVSNTGGLQEQDEFYAPIDQTGEQGQATPKYINSTKKVVYRGSWVVCTTGGFSQTRTVNFLPGGTRILASMCMRRCFTRCSLPALLKD